MKNKILITSTLPYSNSKNGHIGHSLEFIMTDALSKYLKLKLGNKNVFFNTGLDEHGSKIFDKATEENIPVKEYLDVNYISWKKFCSDFEIKYDNFYRTSDKTHYAKVQKFWSECLERGDLYLKTYSGKYCKGCESYKTETDLTPEGKCADHNKEPEIIEEENWFFKVTKYKEKLILWLDNNPNFLSPSSKTEELRNVILKSEDISVSRLKTNSPWGIPVPNDEEQVIYIWMDALMNYTFCVDDFNSYDLIQTCGPDNLRFQGSLFQILLESANLNHTKKLLVHGTILDSEGRKMSKTIGNVIDPIEQLKKYGLDAVRYYTLAGLTTFGNGCWSETDLIKTYNSELADDFGNLIARALHLIDTKNVEINSERCDDVFLKEVYKQIEKAKSLWDNFEINQALKETNYIVKSANKYINDTKPWNSENYGQILNSLYQVLIELSKLYMPVLSSKTNEVICSAIKNKKKVIIFEKLTTQK